MGDSDSSQCEDPSKLTEDEKEEVGVKVLEALDENFKTHEEKIALLTNGHSKKDESTEGEEEDEESQEEGEESQDDEEMKEGETKKGEAETKNGEAEAKTEDKMETESVGDDEKTK